jgi:alpha-L-arabinofuranosidase
MYDHVDHYDDYPRDIAVFAGEYAAHTTDRQNNMESALAEAALLTGIEKNADVVKLASYAPLFNRVGHSQWKPDMIWFDDEKVYLTPNYYVQMLFANHVGDETIPMNGQEKELRKDGIYVSLSRTQQGETILKVANVNDSDYTLPLTDGADVPVEAIGHAWILEGTGEIPEGMPEITDVRETNVQIIGNVTVLAQSFMVLRF